MITCDFQLRGDMSLCEYLYKTIKDLIRCGKIKNDEKLPSKRSLATHLGVSVITVANAYSKLVSEGYMYSVEKKGFFAASDYIDVPETSPRKDMLKKKDSGTDDRDNDEQFAKENVVQTKKIIADLRKSVIIKEKFPFGVWNASLRDVLKTPHDLFFKRSPAQGIYELRKEIADYLRCFRDIDVSPSQIIVEAGIEYLAFVLVCLLGRNITYCVENPGYGKMLPIFENNGVKCIPVDVDDEGIDVGGIRKANASVVHVSPSHHYPTGTVMSLNRREELLSWVSEDNSRFIMENDYDSEFRLIGQPLETLFCASCKEGHKGAGHVIYINNFSKTLSPSYRISYLVLPPSLVELFNSKDGMLACSVSVFEQYALSRYMQSGSYEKHIIHMKNYYRNLRNNLVQAILSSEISKMCTIREQNAGLHFLLEFKDNVSGKALQNSFLENGLDIPLLCEFYQDDIRRNSDKPVFVINYSGISRECIQETVSCMVQSVKSLL